MILVYVEVVKNTKNAVEKTHNKRSVKSIVASD